MKLKTVYRIEEMSGLSSFEDFPSLLKLLIMNYEEYFDSDDESEQNFTDGIETLVLCRTRGEVLLGSSFLRSTNVPHKIRMSGIQEIEKCQLFLGGPIFDFFRNPGKMI